MIKTPTDGTVSDTDGMVGDTDDVIVAVHNHATDDEENPLHIEEQNEPRNPSRRIPQSEVRRILTDAQSVIAAPLGATRSQTRSQTNELGASSAEGNEAEEVAVHETNDETNATLLVSPAEAQHGDESTESSVMKKLTDDEKRLAFRVELGNWERRGAFTPVETKSVPRDANIIGSHSIFKRKLDGTAKARIVPWGHRDKDKDFIRGDAPSVSLDGFRTVLSISAENKWHVALMDMITAFLQALGFNREIYVRPPREATAPGILWKLNAAAYGLTDSGRLWYLTSNGELVSKHGLKRSRYDYTLYQSTDERGKMDFLLAVQVDDYVYTGTDDRMKAFEAFLSSTFEVGTFARGSFSVMGCTITQKEDFSIVVSHEKALQELNPQLLLDAAGKTGDEVATLAQANVYRHVIGKMLYIGRMSAPIILLHASMAASKLADLRTHHLRSLATVIKRVQTQGAELHYLSPPAKASEPFILDIMSDGASAAANDVKGRGGFIIFRRLGNIVHPIPWSARRLRRVSRSSATAEILAAADAVSSGMYIQEVLVNMHCVAPTELTIDSDALLSLSTSVKEPEERYNKVDLAAIREAYDDGQLSAVLWCPGAKLLADALTKDNKCTADLLLDTLCTGQHERPKEMKTNLGHPPPSSVAPR